MFSKHLVPLAGLLAAASAITITEPQQGAKLDLSVSNTVSWTSVDTDTVSFEIVLASPNNSTIAQVVITDSVNTTEKKYTFSNVVTPIGDSYQINFLGNAGTNNGIISQSQSFAVTKSGVASTSSSSSSATGASASASASGTSAASAVGVTFGIAAPIAAALGMLL
ncbi:hypothetical protein Daus18300_000280 [Diaporthe australafricana]|uniref:Yeast cell wall synthesis Kre9/Knh1-like N-terminal domain-containing protein n=1 Tax=Diaporthe australafricana TaxID=127596 RepID=A0ABR3Y5S9_9PEZI